MSWSPDQYLRFADHRHRPGVELLSRIPDLDAGTVVDLGCGPGGLTSALADRWPAARVIGVDSSPQMIERARDDHPGIEFEQETIETWTPEESVDVVYSNATLHWLDHHGRLFPRIFDFVRPGGVLAVQMPNNWDAPTHRIPQQVLAEEDPTLSHVLATDRLDRPGDYRRYLIDRASRIDMWQTTYFQELSGPDPVWEWTTGSLLRPVLAELSGDARDRFEDRVKAGYRDAYPPDHTGTVLLAFTRLFIVAIRD